MSDGKNFSRRRRGGMRFRPSGDNKRRLATDARSEVIAETSGGPERLFDKTRQNEIERAENVAAGLPPESTTPDRPETQAEAASKKNFREPNLETPAEVTDETFKPVEI